MAASEADAQVGEEDPAWKSRRTSSSAVAFGVGPGCSEATLEVEGGRDLPKKCVASPRAVNIPRLSERAAAAQHQVLSCLGARSPWDPQPDEVPAQSTEWAQSLRRLDMEDRASPEILLQICVRWRLTMLDLEVMLIPPLNFTAAFDSKEEFFEYVLPASGALRDVENVKQWSDLYSKFLDSFLLKPSSRNAGHRVGGKYIALPDKSIRCGADRMQDSRNHFGELPDISHHGVRDHVFSSARWYELLDGSILAQLMPDRFPILVPSAINPLFWQPAIVSLREIPWAPEHHWVFPQECQDRLVFLSWIGRVLGLHPTWVVKVLPLLAGDRVCPSFV